MESTQDASFSLKNSSLHPPHAALAVWPSEIAVKKMPIIFAALPPFFSKLANEASIPNCQANVDRLLEFIKCAGLVEGNYITQQKLYGEMSGQIIVSHKPDAQARELNKSIACAAGYHSEATTQIETLISPG